MFYIKTSNAWESCIHSFTGVQKPLAAKHTQASRVKVPLKQAKSTFPKVKTILITSYHAGFLINVMVTTPVEKYITLLFLFNWAETDI